MYARDSSLRTVRRIEDRRVLVCASEEKGFWEHFGGGRGLSIMSVRVEPKPGGLKIQPLIKHTVRYISRRKRVSPLPTSAADPRHLLRCDDDAQKCDAKQPCTPCSDGGRSDCVYEQSQVKPRMREGPPAAARARPFSPKNERNPRRSPSSCMNSQSSSLTPGISSPGFEPPVHWEGSIPKTELVSIRDKSPPPFQPATPSVLPSLRFPSIPHQLHTPLSFFGSEHFQVSNATSSELDMALWVLPFLECPALCRSKCPKKK